VGWIIGGVILVGASIYVAEVSVFWGTMAFAAQAIGLYCWYGTLGHPSVRKETDVQMLREEMARLESQLNTERQRRFDAEAAAMRETEKRKRLQNRVKAGVEVESAGVEG